MLSEVYPSCKQVVLLLLYFRYKLQELKQKLKGEETKPTEEGKCEVEECNKEEAKEKDELWD